MPRRRIALGRACAALVFAAAVLAAPAPMAMANPPFTQVAYDDAVKANATDGKVLVVVFTATWCGPCQRMKRESWPQAQVTQWFERNGTAILVDVDQNPQVAQALSVQGIPLLVAFKDGKEVSRSVGFRSASQLVSWLDGLAPTTTASDPEPAPAMQAPSGEQISTNAEVNQRITRARVQVRERRPMTAADDYAWLWTNMLRRDASLAGFRSTTLAAEMQAVSRQSAVVKQRFAQLRAPLQGRLREATAMGQDRQDWLTLNWIVDDHERTAQWFDGLDAATRGSEAFTPMQPNVEIALAGLARWSDIAAMHPNVMESLRKTVEGGEALAGVLPIRAGASYAALLSGGKAADATAFIAEALKAQDSTAMRLALVRAALDVKQPRAEQRAILVPTGAEGASLMTALEEALK